LNNYVFLFVFYINNHRHRRSTNPGTVKLRESPQQNWGLPMIIISGNLPV
jgi:hypothetical protein